MASRGSSTAIRQPIQPASSTWRGRLVFACTAALAAIAVLAYITFYFGCVSGQEFSPDTFQRRSFYYFEIPLLGWQVWPISRDDCSNPLENHLTGEKRVVVEKKPSAAVRWDLVAATRGFNPRSTRPTAQGDARVLCLLLDAQDSEGNYIWLEWTKRNPKLAAVLWPAVATVCRQELYLFTPELLELASGEASLQRLSDGLNATLTKRYCELAAAHQRLQRHETAVELFSEAIRCQPASIAARTGRAASLRAMGKAKEAASDLAEATRLEGLSAAESAAKSP